MATWNLQQFIQRLENWGLIDVMLPFLLAFTLVFAILEKAKVFGDDRRNINMVVAIIMGLTVVIPHVMGSYPAGWDVVNIINRALPIIAAVVVAVIMLLLLIGAWGGQAKWTAGSLATWIFFVSLIIVIWVFGAAAGRLPGWDWLRSFLGEDVISLIVIILVFAIIIGFITGRNEGEKKGHDLSKIGTAVGDFFSGGKH